VEVIKLYLEKLATLSLLYRQELIWFSLGAISILILKSVI